MERDRLELQRGAIIFNNSEYEMLRKMINKHRLQPAANGWHILRGRQNMDLDKIKKFIEIINSLDSDKLEIIMPMVLKAIRDYLEDHHQEFLKALRGE